jgi:tetratricopeptide (TPR) repeat protein
MHKKLSASHEAVEAEQFKEAAVILKELEKRAKRLNPYERSLVYQMLGMTEASQEKYEQALVYFEKCLLEDALPHGAIVSTRFMIAQLYMATEEFEKAVKTLEKWFKEVETPNANAYYLLAAAYYQLDQIDKAIAPAETAIKIAKKPKPPWLQLLVGLYYETKQYPKAVKPLETLIVLNPKEEYLTQLVDLLARLDRWEEVADLLDERTVEVSDWVLIDASADGRSDIVELLAARGADLDATSNNELTALHQAARSGHEETVRLLLDLGADPYATDASGRTAAQLAAESGHQAVARLLLHATRRD